MNFNGEVVNNSNRTSL